MRDWREQYAVDKISGPCGYISFPLPIHQSLINRIATPNFAFEKAELPGMKAIMFHLTANESSMQF